MSWCRDYLRLLIPGPHKTVLMGEKEGQWDFPAFQFQERHPLNFSTVFADLDGMLDQDPSDTRFVAVAELMGAGSFRVRPIPGGSWDDVIQSHMLWVEPQVPLVDLPVSWGWKDETFLWSLLGKETDDQSFEYIIKRAVTFLSQDLDSIVYNWQPRFQPGWYKKACTWLEKVVQAEGHTTEGPVEQVRMTIASTVMKAKCSNGDEYYLKAPLRIEEIKLTKTIEEILPLWTVQTVAESKSLHCFVSKGFETANRRDPEAEEVSSDMIRALGEMQIASLRHTDSLVEQGCPLLGVPQLIADLDELIFGEVLPVKRPSMVRNARSWAPEIYSLLRILEEYNIPLTLTHGDFSKGNVGFIRNSDGTERITFFDWEYAAVSHPFFDFHRFHNRALTNEQINDYLSIWTAFEPLERCREAFLIAKGLGWVMKLIVWFHHFPKSTPGSGSEVVDIFTDFWSDFKTRVSKLSELHKDRIAINTSNMGT